MFSSVPINRRSIALLLLFACISLCSSSTRAAPKEPLEQVSLQLKWTHAFQFAGYYMALHNGYYEQEGLDVEIRPGSPNIDVTEQVTSGQADFGVGTSDLLLDYAAGKPVKVLGVIYQHSPVVLIMRADKPSDTIEDLIGKPIMIESHAADVFAMFKRKGISLDTLNCITHTGNSDALVQSDAHAIFAYLTNEPYLLDQQHIQYFILSPRTYGIDFYGDNFFTSQKTVKKRKDVVERFRTATIRGWNDALAQPEQAVNLIIENYKTSMSREHLLYEARITQDLMTSLVTPGYMLPDRWKHIAATYQEVGMLEAMPDLNNFMYLKKNTSLPSWFREAVFGMIISLVLLLIFTLYYKYRNARLKQELTSRTYAEHQNQLRLQQLLVRDIHDGLGGLASNLAFMSVFAQDEQTPVKRNEWLKKIERTANETNTEIQDLMNALEKTSMKWGGVIASIRQATEILFIGGETTVEFHIGNLPPDEDVGIAEGLSLARMARECMNNVVKHAKADLVDIYIEISPQHFELIVSDNGIGFESDGITRGRGLNNIGKRSEELGGTYTVTSNNGTRLAIDIPLPIRIVKEIEC